jgi:hypothetical protein
MLRNHCERCLDLANPDSHYSIKEMDTLTSKVQYSNFEKGEFTNIAPRTFEEVKQQIIDYPWQEQRHGASVELTCPSVTIEQNYDSFLKLGPYFNGKFCLYLCENHQVYEKVCTALEDSFDIIYNYFLDNSIRNEFEKYQIITNPTVHFATNSFEYKADLKRIFWFLSFPVLFPFLPFALWMIVKLTTPSSISIWLEIFIFIIFSIGLGGVNLYLFFNYFRYDKNQVIIISKGLDIFYYGPVDQANAYDKKDIININLYRFENSRASWNDYSVYEIEFKDGRQIRFSSLLLSHWLFGKKFAGHRINIIGKFLATM